MEFNKKSLVVALSLFLSCSAFGQNNVGTLVTDPIRPFSVNSTNPSAIANEIKGGPFSSSNLVGLSNIPSPRLELGAIGYAADTGLYYRLTSTNPATWSSINGANITNIAASNVVGAISGTVAISNGGTGATNAGEARTNLGLGATNVVSFSNVSFGAFFGGATLAGFDSGGQMFRHTNIGTVPATTYFLGNIGGTVTNWTVSNARTALGLGSWTTNTNTPVFVSANGTVVSPTNFWQAAPILTLFEEFQPTVNLSIDAPSVRNYHVHSLAPSINGITSTIVLPTNAATLAGDIALVVHQGPTSSVTRVRQAGSTNNLMTMNRFDEAVEFIYYNNVWQFNHNKAFIEPIYFSGTNALVNAAASRTNLGLGNISMGSNSIVVTTNFTATNGSARFTNLQTDYLEFRTLFVVGTNTNAIIFEEPAQRTNFLNSLGLGAGSTTEIGFGAVKMGGAINFIEPVDQEVVLGLSTDTDPVYLNPIHWNDTNVRTSLGLGAANNVTFSNVIASGTLTSSSSLVTPNLIIATNGLLTFYGTSAGFSYSAGATTNQIRSTLGLGTTNNVAFSNITASGTLTATSTVTAKTNLVVEGFVDYTTSRTNNTPTNIPNFAAHAAWIEVKIGTNSFFLPAYQ